MYLHIHKTTENDIEQNRAANVLRRLRVKIKKEATTPRQCLPR